MNFFSIELIFLKAFKLFKNVRNEIKKTRFSFYKFEQQRGGALQKGSPHNDNHFLNGDWTPVSFRLFERSFFFLNFSFLVRSKKFLTLKMDSFFNAGLVRPFLGSEIGNLSEVGRDVACQKFIQLRNHQTYSIVHFHIAIFRFKVFCFFVVKCSKLRSF